MSDTSTCFNCHSDIAKITYEENRVYKVSCICGCEYTFNHCSMYDAIQYHYKMVELYGEIDRNKVLQAELAKYREAETDGRLVVLPCKTYQRVYKICDKWAKHYGCYGCLDDYDHGTICAYWDKDKEECTNFPGMYGDNQIISIGFRYEHIPELGKTVFLTREEAEAVLTEVGQS